MGFCYTGHKQHVREKGTLGKMKLLQRSDFGRLYVDLEKQLDNISGNLKKSRDEA